MLGGTGLRPAFRASQRPQAGQRDVAFLAMPRWNSNAMSMRGNARISEQELSEPPAVRAITSATSARTGLDVPLETKLHAPTAREGWVERPELIQHLASGAARLVLDDAPAGFGKTTLVAQWRASTLDGRPFAWVSLDSGDNDPARLWWHVVSALQRASPEFVGSEIVTALRAKVPDLAGTVLPMLVNELAALDEPV